MYYQLVAQCARNLRNVEVWIDNAQELAAAKHFDLTVLLNARLAPDMKNFIFQIQAATDYIKGAAAWLSGQTPPPYPDTEKTVEEIRERIRKTLAFVESVKESQYQGAAERKVTFSWAPGRYISGHDYLLEMVIPNSYFHMTTAYAILRHNGVNIGKMDFLGSLNLAPLKSP